MIIRDLESTIQTTNNQLLLKDNQLLTKEIELLDYKNVQIFAYGLGHKQKISSV